MGEPSLSTVRYIKTGRSLLRKLKISASAQKEDARGHVLCGCSVVTCAGVSVTHMIKITSSTSAAVIARTHSRVVTSAIGGAMNVLMGAGHAEGYSQRSCLSVVMKSHCHASLTLRKHCVHISAPKHSLAGIAAKSYVTSLARDTARKKSLNTFHVDTKSKLPAANPLRRCSALNHAESD